jgi:HSP20 family protein
MPRDAEEIAVRSAGWGMLASEVFDDDERIVMRIEAPGMDKDDFDLTVVNGCLLIRGRKQMEREHSRGRYHVVECAYGQFERAVPLPDEVELDKAKATYKRGVLRVDLPKSRARRERSIQVKVR